MLILPKNYKSKLSVKETQNAIKLTRVIFENKLCEALNLVRVSAPLFVVSGEGINDDLNGVERAVSFDIKVCPEKEVQIVHSLAKWKRISLKHYGFEIGEGIYTNMNAIRRDEDLDNIHSIYVDQWDWEMVITRGQRNAEYLKEVVRSIAAAIADTAAEVKRIFPALNPDICREVFFITSQELEDMYPSMTAKERENAITKEKKTVFIMQIGGKLKSGAPHDGRAPDYDDWSLNGDILYWDDLLGIALELTSMGIRVDENSLAAQLQISGCENRKSLMYHKMLLNGELPLTIGGGIGQSRLCMLILEKAHIAEVHASVWPADMVEKCAENGINFL